MVVPVGALFYLKIVLIYLLALSTIIPVVTGRRARKMALKPELAANLQIVKVEFRRQLLLRLAYMYPQYMYLRSVYHGHIPIGPVVCPAEHKLEI